jgi:hypothetical protein
MRIEMPLPSWAEAQHAHDDAHTLTVPAQHPHVAPTLPATWIGGDVVAARVEVSDLHLPALTITF